MTYARSIRTCPATVLFLAIAGTASPLPAANQPAAPPQQTAESAPSDESKTAETAEKAKDKAAQEKPDDALKLDGVFAPGEEAIIELRPLEWTEYRIKTIVPSGTSILAGEVLIEFEGDAYQQRLSDLEREVLLAEIAQSQAEEKLSRLRKTAPLDLAAAERAQRIASEDLQQFLTVGKEQRIKNEHFNLKRSQDYLEYDEEELKQLLKMYEEDDLTEESEEIVLRRTRDDVEARRFLHEGSAQRMEEALQYEIPRLESRLEEALRRATLELERLRVAMPADLRREELNLEQEQQKLVRLREKLAHLRADAQWLIVKSPLTGVVIYGEHDRGRWGNIAELVKRMRPKSPCKPETALMTVVGRQPLKILASVEEKDLRHVAEGGTCQVQPVAYPDRKFTATVTKVGRYPSNATRYSVDLAVAIPDGVPLVAGMNCHLNFAKKTGSAEESTKPTDSESSPSSREK